MKLLEGMLNLIFPIECVGCEWHGTYLCGTCKDSIALHIESVCLQCHKKTLLGRICKDCEEDFAIDRVLIATDYDQELIHKLVWNFKYNFVKEISLAVSEIIFDYMKQNNIIKVLNIQEAALIPVPLHIKRFQYRSFNQSEEVAHALARCCEWEVHNALKRVKYTKSQLHYNKKERNMNLKNAFEVNANVKLPETVILIDDIVTTGSTLNIAAEELKRAGVKRVYGLVLAKRQ